MSCISFPDLFCSQVKKKPREVAAIFEGQKLTYEELNDQSLQVANLLKSKGAKPQSIIGLSCHNSLKLSIAMLGILRAGCVYLPIDPDYPKNRIETMIQDARPLLVLAEEELQGRFSNFPITSIDSYVEYPKLEFQQNLQASDLAYIVFTSGSTGKPKGILLEHRALSHAATVFASKHPAKLISLMTGSISFDASLLVMAHSLVSGGTICIPKSGIDLDFREVGLLIREHRINYTLCLPSFYEMLLSKHLELPSLEVVDLGGDNIPASLPLLHAKLAPNAILHNVYGPSEYAVGATIAKIYDPITKKIERISIGKPLPNTKMYILDENMQEVSVGLKGEIFIGGEGLARGYLNQDDLSKEKFIEISVKDIGNTHVYRSGDFGSFASDGNIDFHGRMDNQVKLRGYRIEIGEIEYQILQYPDISQAIVVVNESQDGRKVLAAYFSSESDIINISDLQVFLNSNLPHYMVPLKLINMKNWPLTPNGKIDRNLLKDLPFQKSHNIVSLPSSEIEKTLFGIWKELLSHDRFTLNDNFFELGGDSLQIVEMQTLLEDVLEIRVKVADLFQYPTISMLANHISENEKLPNKQSYRKKVSFVQFKNKNSKST